jgi:hypothetical protein
MEIKNRKTKSMPKMQSETGHKTRKKAMNCDKCNIELPEAKEDITQCKKCNQFYEVIDDMTRPVSNEYVLAKMMRELGDKIESGEVVALEARHQKVMTQGKGKQKPTWTGQLAFQMIYVEKKPAP